MLLYDLQLNHGIIVGQRNGGWISSSQGKVYGMQWEKHAVGKGVDKSETGLRSDCASALLCE